jgi:hypothetical protein
VADCSTLRVFWVVLLCWWGLVTWWGLIWWLYKSSSLLLSAAFYLMLQPLLKRCRPLARVSGQFMPDLAALLSGLRSTVMLDYAPGVNPQQLRSVLGVLCKLLHDEQQSPAWRQFTGNPGICWHVWADAT